MVAGHLRVKRGIYQIILIYKDFEGNKKEKSISTGLPEKNNKKKAESLLLEARRSFVPPEQPTDETLLSKFLLNWMEGTKHSIEMSTYGSYETCIRRINEYFADKILSSLEAKDIQDYYTYLMNEKKRTANTVIHYHAVLKKSLQYAMRMDIINTNPMDRVDRPKKETFVGEFYKAEEINALLEVVKGEKIELPIMIAAFYGLRRSEIVGLKWDAIDFTNKTITVKHTVVQTMVNGEYTLIQKDRAKNKSSLRSLPLVPEFECLLLDLKEKQEEYRQLCGNCYNYDYDGYILVDEMGNLMKPNYITQKFNAILKSNELRKIRFHDLRHSCASILLANGVPLKEIQEWLGHSNFSTTANTYAHLEKDSKQNSAHAMRNSGISFNMTPTV